VATVSHRVHTEILLSGAYSE